MNLTAPFFGTLAIVCGLLAGCLQDQENKVNTVNEPQQIKGSEANSEDSYVDSCGVERNNFTESYEMRSSYCCAQATSRRKSVSAEQNPAVPLGSKYRKSARYPYLIAKPCTITDLRGEKGMLLTLENPLPVIVPFPSIEDRLFIVQEAQDQYSQWCPIEYMREASCGNSYYDAYLPAEHKWNFTVPRYKGDFKTSLRFQLKCRDTIIYSNVFAGSIHPSQFSEMSLQ